MNWIQFDLPKKRAHISHMIPGNEIMTCQILLSQGPHEASGLRPELELGRTTVYHTCIYTLAHWSSYCHPNALQGALKRMELSRAQCLQCFLGCCFSDRKKTPRLKCLNDTKLHPCVKNGAGAGRAVS